jgi:hypothetical protein
MKILASKTMGEKNRGEMRKITKGATHAKRKGNLMKCFYLDGGG